MLVVAGVLLWTVNLAYARPLFLDEANVARNLYDRGFAGLFLPLDHEQYAPPLYLVLTKGLAELFGYGETVLRLPAFAGGLLAIYGLYRAAHSLGLGYWTLLPLALLFTNPTVLRFVGEVKPYGLDLGIAACLLAMYLGGRPRWQWLVVGVVSPWFSLPAAFVLAAVGLAGLVHDRRWVVPIGGWLASFAILYFSVLRQSVGSTYLDDFHAVYFFPLLPTVGNLQIAGDQAWNLLRLLFGYTAVSLLWGGLLVVAGVLRFRLRYLFLGLPLLFAVASSAFHFYSLIDRLMLFALPGLWLLIALSARSLYRQLPSVLRIAFLAASLVALGGTNVVGAYYRPLTFGDGRALAALAEAHPYRANSLARPVLDYYLRIHSAAPGERAPARPGDTGEVYWLYDVATAPAVRATLTADSLRLTGRGCVLTKIELFRAAVLRVRCPPGEE
ncbi:hypothetical protein [Lewinella sp. IMCC34183]|uniref:hypothetical protein n=1 Tax=Lewinella sp. IMCC34183 TaxID=2248762 RepID=UPI000E2780AB|nr:hypothetical protein [Lewinella sp. IMCC34183]